VIGLAELRVPGVSLAWHPAARHRCIRRWLTFAALCVVFGGLMSFSTGQAGAAPLSDCSPHRGTVVAVDFAHWGGPLVRGCGIGQPSGLALLHAAGFTTGGDAHDGAAFVCRIGNRAFDGGTIEPTPSEESCNGTPGTSAYWSYWVAPAGHNSWTYSALGPMGDVPKPGEVELWMFGATNVSGTRGSGVPKFPPRTLRAAGGTSPAHHTSPSTTSPRTATHSTSAPVSIPRTGHRSTAKRPARTEHQQQRRRARKRPGAQPRDRRAAAGSAPVSSAPRTRPAVVAAQPTAERTSSGSAAPLVVGLCLALALSGGAVWAVRRRRRYE
jgi:hypothetical protein